MLGKLLKELLMIPLMKIAISPAQEVKNIKARAGAGKNKNFKASIMSEVKTVGRGLVRRNGREYIKI